MAAVSARFKWIAIAIATIALAFTLTGCGGQDYTKNFVGNYEMTGMITDGEETSSEDIQLLKEWGLTVTLELKEDKTGTLDLMGSNYSISFSPKSATEASMEMTDEDGSKAKGMFTVKDDALLLTDEGSDAESITFTKIKS